MAEGLLLHLPTLQAVAGIVIATSSLALLLLAWRQDAFVVLACWGASMLSGAAGMMLLARGAVPAPPGIAGEALILLGAALLWTGARAFAGVPPWTVLLFAGPAGWVAWALLQAGAAPDMLTVGAQLACMAYTAAAAAEIWRGWEERLQSRRVGAVLLAVHATMHLLRAASIASGGLGLDPRLAAIVVVFEMLLHTVGMAFVLLAVMKERAELHTTERLRVLAFVDSLTGLGNRRQFDAALEREHKRALRSRTPLALLMLDVDHFKSFNDAYGHQAGDDCLRAIAAAVQANVHRPGDVAVRYGGEEFAALLPRTDAAGALAVAAGIHAAVAALGLAHARLHGAVSVSIGAAVARPLPGASPKAMVLAADRALYSAKNAGRKRTVLAAGAPAARLALADGKR